MLIDNRSYSSGGRPRQQHPPLLRVDAGHRGFDEANAARAAEAAQVDMGLFEAVVPGHQARQHTRSRARSPVSLTRVMRSPGDRAHGQHAQDQDMGVAAAQQHQVAARRRCDHALRSVPWPRAMISSRSPAELALALPIWYSYMGS